MDKTASTEERSAAGTPIAYPWRLECHAELPSTSDSCVERAGQGEADGLAILALHQTRGRGSRGRTWSDPGDSLALSALLRPTEMEQRDSTGWAFVAALAFYDGLSRSRLSPRLRLKWPNDILLDGRKMAGLLVEADGGETPWVVIGFGANLARAPRIEGRRLACLAEYATVCEPRVVAERVLNALAFWRQVWNREGFAEIRRSWLARSLPAGTPLVVSVGSTYSEGLFMGIGEGGELLLDVKGKQERLFTGEVFYGGSAVSRMDAGRASGR